MFVNWSPIDFCPLKCTALTLLLSVHSLAQQMAAPRADIAAAPSVPGRTNRSIRPMVAVTLGPSSQTCSSWKFPLQPVITRERFSSWVFFRKLHLNPSYWEMFTLEIQLLGDVYSSPLPWDTRGVFPSLIEECPYRQPTKQLLTHSNVL